MSDKPEGHVLLVKQSSNSCCVRVKTMQKLKVKKSLMIPLVTPNAVIAICLLPALAAPAQTPLPLAPHSLVVDISGSAGRFTEPSLALNPNHPEQLVAVYQGGAGVQGLGAAAYSTNSGRTFTLSKGTTLPDWRVVGDVTTTFDNQGRAFWCYLVFDKLGTPSYWAHNVSRNGIFVRRSPDGGKTWEKGVPVSVFPTGHEPDIQFEDEPRIFADHGPDNSVKSPYAGNLYVGWVEWQLDKSIMLFSRSADAGQTWSHPLRIDTHAGLPRDDNGSLGGFMQAVAPDGALYAIWSDGNTIVFTESHDGGQSFAPPRPILATAPPYFGDLPGIGRASGFGQIALDTRPGQASPRLYVTWSDYRNGDVDVFLSASTDLGRTWSPATRVNDDPVHDGADQFFQSMTVDPVTGDIYAVFYDRRADPANRKLCVTLARSTDGGQTFRNYAWTHNAWDGQKAFLGDYTWITAYNNRVYAAWTETVPRPAAAPTANPKLNLPKTKVRVGTADFSGAN